MCGIFGMYSRSPLAMQDLPVLREVANSQVARGHHAFGLAWRNEDRQVMSFKRPGAIVDHPDDVDRGEGALGLIGHTRWATHGSIHNNDNNHPHPFEWKRSQGFLVHNGVIGNYEDIAAERGLSLRTDCDSEVLARHIESGKGSLLQRVADAIADVDTFAPCAVAVLTESCVVIARRGNPMFWSTHGTLAWFASTQDALPGKVYQVPDNMAYMIPIGAGKATEMPLRARKATTRLFVGSDLFA